MAAFRKSVTSNPELMSITIDRTCSNIKNIVTEVDDGCGTVTNNYYYPWLNDNAPYTASGVTIYGSNGEVCDTF